MSGRDLVAEVVRAVADADGVDPVEAEPLHEYVDPDVLRGLEGHEDGEWTFTFRYSDHQVTVTSDSLLVDGVSYRSDASAK